MSRYGVYDPDDPYEWINYIGWDDFFEKGGGNYSPYIQYLHSPIWRKKRKEKLWQVGFHCEMCGIGDHYGVRLEVHHKTYERVTEELLEDLEVLCDKCHEAKHKSGVKIKMPWWYYEQKRLRHEFEMEDKRREEMRRSSPEQWRKLYSRDTNQDRVQGGEVDR